MNKLGVTCPRSLGVQQAKYWRINNNNTKAHSHCILTVSLHYLVKYLTPLTDCDQWLVFFWNNVLLMFRRKCHKPIYKWHACTINILRPPTQNQRPFPTTETSIIFERLHQTINIWNLYQWLSFVRLLLQAEVPPTLNLSADTISAVQCACSGRGGELVGVCDVCVCVTCGEGELSRSEQHVEYF